MIEEVKKLPVIETLAELLVKNVDKFPLTDLYLAFPVLKSKDCPKSFPQLIKSCIVGGQERIKELVNSAVYSVEALLLLGEFKQSSIVQDTVKWIKQQRLEDGGWHWRPKHELARKAGSEVWITLAIYDLLKRVGEDQAYLESIRDYLYRSLEKTPKEKMIGWSRLAYIRTALRMLEDPYVRPSMKKSAQEYLLKTIEKLKSQQLPNGGWAGSKKTKQGGIFQTVMVLNTLVEAGLDLSDESIQKGFTFVAQRIDRLLHAKWGGVLIQALSIFADTLLKLKLIN
ncbi:MAG: hypothetical protein ACE5KD_04610 [Candidatus Bathyarchaeia archaeon]